MPRLRSALCCCPARVWLSTRRTGGATTAGASSAPRTGATANASKANAASVRFTTLSENIAAAPRDGQQRAFARIVQPPAFAVFANHAMVAEVGGADVGPLRIVGRGRLVLPRCRRRSRLRRRAHLENVANHRGEFFRRGFERCSDAIG